MLTLGTKGGFFEPRAEHVEAPGGIIGEELAKGMEGQRGTRVALMSGPPLHDRTFVFLTDNFPVASLVPRKTSNGVSWWQTAGGVHGLGSRTERIGGKVSRGEGEANDMVGRELG